MTTAGEIYDYIDSFAPFDTAMDFDNVGLLVGAREISSKKVLVSLDVTSATILEALEKGAKIIVSHHPIIFSPLKNLLSDSIPFLAAAAGVTVISAHTNLDIAVGGVNDTLARAAGVSFTEGTDSSCCLYGTFEKEYNSSEELCGKLCEALSCKGIRFTSRKGRIKSVCVACGAGGSSIFSAAKRGTDALITGEIKHHELLFAKEKNIAVFDVGHYCSENLIVRELIKKLSEKFPSCCFISSETGGDGTDYYVNTERNKNGT